MNLGRDQILELLRSQGQHDQAVGELGGKMGTGNARHTEMLSKYGIDPPPPAVSSAALA
jgi:hypothetical protein